MTVLNQAIQLVSVPPGNLTYHLVVFFSLVMAAIVSLSLWQRYGWASSGRLAFAAGVILLGRLTLMISAGLAWQGILSSSLVLPPLDRAISTITILLLIWALAGLENNRAVDALLGGGILVALAGFAISLILWDELAGTGAFYNGQNQETVWEIAQTALLGLGLLALLLRRPEDWGVGLIIVFLLLVGHTVHLVTPLPEADLPGAERLAELASLPLLAVLAFRRATAYASPFAEVQPAQPATEAPSAPQEALASPRARYTTDPRLLSEVARLAELHDPAQLAQAAVRATGQAFLADICLLLAPHASEGSISVQCGYDLIRENPLPPTVIKGGAAPALHSALQRGRGVRFQPGRHAPDLAALNVQLGYSQIGPAVFAPLTYEGQSFGGLLLLSPFAQRDWSQDDQNLLSEFAGGVAATFSRASRIAELEQSAGDIAAQLTQAARNEEAARRNSEELARALADSHHQYEQEHQQTLSLAALVGQHTETVETTAGADTASERDQLRAEIERLLQELEAARQKAGAYAEGSETGIVGDAVLAGGVLAATGSASEVQRLEVALKQSLEEMARLNARLAEADEEILRLNKRASTTEQQADHLSALLSKVEEDKQQLRAQLSEGGQEKDWLNSALRKLEEERQQSSARVAEIEQERDWLSSALRNLEEQRGGSAQESDLLRARLSEMKTKAAPPVISAPADQRELEHLRAMLAETEEEKRLLLGRMAEDEEERKLLASRLAGTDTNEAQLRERLAQAESDSGRLAGHLKEAEAAFKALKESLASANAASADAPTAAHAGKAPPLNAEGQLNAEVIASLAQELRQPMSTITGYTDLLLGESVGILGALQRKFLERVKAGGERMRALLDDLIRVAAIDSGTLNLAPEPVDVLGVIDDAFSNAGAQFREKGILLKMDIPDDLPPVTADRDALYQIVSHLLSNAGSASKQGGEVVVSASREGAGLNGNDGDFLLITVRDSGLGISRKDLPRVFTRIYRADNPLIEGLGDTGVGLSIVRTLVDAHGGRVWVESEKGQGTTFSVLMPVAETSMAAAVDAEFSRNGAGNPKSAGALST